MSEIKLYELKPTVSERTSSTVLLEKELQTLIEANMETLFSVRFLKSEYAISEGRMDSIGIDENNCPVIFEYKRSVNENVINQGLFYLDWLLDHKADFKLLVLEKFGKEAAELIDWSMPCVICVAADFTKYDIHAVNQMQRNIRLVRYKKYGDDLLMFEHLNAPQAVSIPTVDATPRLGGVQQKSHLEKLSVLIPSLRVIYDELCLYISSLGDDISQNQVKLYLAFKKVSNFCCIEVYHDKILLRLRLNPDKVPIESGFSRDTRGIGHYGTGEFEITIRTAEDYAKAKPYIERAYNEA